MHITSFCVNYMLLVQITLFKGIITSFAFLMNTRLNTSKGLPNAGVLVWCVSLNNDNNRVHT